MPDPDVTLEELARVLQPNGVLILGYPLENRLFTSLEALTVLEYRLRSLIQGQRVRPQGKPFHPHVTDCRGLEKNVEKVFKIESRHTIRIVGAPVYRILKLRKESTEL
jgi:ubiquinone/menaquinone biosynthesis C-methylase UbiE